MAGTQVNPTRMELTRLKKKLVTAVRGHKLLKDKRDELMRQFLDKVRENKALREEVETALVSANQNFMLARAGMPDEMLNTALLAPKQELTISAGTQNVMSCPSTYLMVTTTFMTASFATRPTRMPITTDTSKMKGRLVKIFFISAAFLRLRLAIWSNTLP